jgi:long-subunit fatty acid transport protein
MCFSERRARLRRRRRTHARARRAPTAAAAAIALLLLASRAANAAPLDEPFVGGMSFDGPTSANLGAVYWNPAALGLVRGFQLMVAASGRLSTVEVNRAPINSGTGTPRGTTTIPGARARDLTGPSPFGPHSFFALSTDFGGDRFTIAFATYMPYLQRITFPLSPNRDEPTRYQALAIDLRNLLLAPALSIRFGGDFRVGFAPGFLFSTGRLAFAEDTALNGGSAGLQGDCLGMACGAENPAAAARYDVYSGHDIGDAKFSVTLGAGIYYRKRSLELGVAYQSHPLGSDVSGVEVAGPRTTVTLPPNDPVPGAGGNVLGCSNMQSNRCIFGDISYRLPDVWIAGATWRLRPGLELSAMVRWLWLSMHDRIDIRVSGPPLDNNGRNLPQHIVLWRGFKDVWDTRLRISYWWRERIRVGAMLRVETSAVDTAAVNAAAVDGLKLQPVALIEFRILRQLWLGGGYGITFMRAVDVTDSVFKPELAPRCVNPPSDPMMPGAGGSLTSADCQARSLGQARPTAAGRYTAQTQDFGVTLTLKF